MFPLRRGHRAARARLRRRRPLHRPHPDHLGRPRLLSLERHSSMLRAAVERDSYWAHIGAWDAGAASHRDSSRLSSRLHWSYTTCVMPQAPDDLNQNDCFLSALNVFRCRAHPLLSPNSNVSYYMSRRWLRRMRVVCCMCGMCVGSEGMCRVGPVFFPFSLVLHYSMHYSPGRCSLLFLGLQHLVVNVCK